MSTIRGGRRSNGNGCLYAALAGGVCLIAIGAGIDMLSSLAAHRADAPPPPVFEPQRPVTAEPPQPAEPAQPPDLYGPTPESLPIVWLAQIERSPDVEAGTPCTLALDVDRAPNQLIPRRVTLECNGRPIQQSSLTDAVVSEVPLGDGWYAYRLRGDVADLSLATGVHRVRAGAHELFVEDLSVPRQWAPFLDENAGWVSDVTHRLRRRALVTSVSGQAPAALTELASCELMGDAAPLGGELNCRFVLRCGGDVLYGAGNSGYGRCAMRDGSIVGANDPGTTPENTDPRFHIDVDASSVEISDVGESGEWAATLRILTDDAACADLAGWRGEMIDPDGTRSSWSLDASAGALVWDDGHTESVTFATDCATGILDAHVGADTYRVWIGPASRSMTGERITGSRRLLIARR